jgi:membrane-bound ClpP family serine protease
MEQSLIKLQNNARLSLGFGAAFLCVAFLIFLFYGNVASGIVLLVLGVTFIAIGGRHKGSAIATQSGTPQ